MMPTPPPLSSKTDFSYMGKDAMPRVKGEAAAVRTASLWCALAYLGGKRGDRSIIAEGSSTPLELEIVGKVGRGKVAEQIAGSLEIGRSQTVASSTAADADELLALVLKEVGDADRQAAVLERIAQEFTANAGLLPVPNPAAVERIQAWRKRLRSSVQTTRRGALSFALATE